MLSNSVSIFSSWFRAALFAGAVVGAGALFPARAFAQIDWLSEVERTEDAAGSLEMLLRGDRPFRNSYRTALQGLYGRDHLPDEAFEIIADRALWADSLGELARSRLFAPRAARFNMRIQSFRLSPNVLMINGSLCPARRRALMNGLATQGGFSPSEGPSAGQLTTAASILETAALRVSAAQPVGQHDFRRLARDLSVRTAAAAIAWRRLRASDAAGLLAADRAGILLAELLRLRGAGRDGEGGATLSERARALAAFASPDPNGVLDGEGLLRWQGERPRVLIKPDDVEVRAPKRAISAVFALPVARDCLANYESADGIADTRLFAIAVAGAEASFFLRDQKWIGHIFSIPFRRGGEIYASIEALGTELGVASTALNAEGSLVTRSLFDHWLAGAYRIIRGSGNWRRFVIASGHGRRRGVGAKHALEPWVRDQRSWIRARAVGVGRR